MVEDYLGQEFLEGAAQIDEIKNFYEADDNDILIFDLEEREA